MKIDFNQAVHSKNATKFIIKQLLKAEEAGYIERRLERNDYLMISFAGVESMGITRKWNIKIYTYSGKRGGHSVVCVDTLVLRHLVEEAYDRFTPPSLPLLSIDDAGWGFPLCGVMVGVSDEREVYTRVVPVEYFRADGPNGFITKRYLDKYGDLAVEILNEMGATPATHRVEICTGYVNQPLRSRLRPLGYDVRVTEIRGLLQERLESLFRAYVAEELGADIYYDPKAIAKADIPRRYRECVEFGLSKHPDKLKTGWRSFSADPQNVREVSEADGASPG